MSVGTVLTAISLLKDAAPYLGKLAEKFLNGEITKDELEFKSCLLYTSPSPRDRQKSRMPSSA